MEKLSYERFYMAVLEAEVSRKISLRMIGVSNVTDLLRRLFERFGFFRKLDQVIWGQALSQV